MRAYATVYNVGSAIGEQFLQAVRRVRRDLTAMMPA